MWLCNTLPSSSAMSLEHVAEKWEQNLKAYELLYDTTDSVHWYNERTNIGAFASAIWMSGGVAIEEYGSKKEDTGDYTGRNDLYFHINDIKAVAEAKLVWAKTGYKRGYEGTLTDLSNDSIGRIDKAIENAEQDINKVVTDHEKFILVFVNTYYKQDLYEKPEVITILEDHLKKIRSALVLKYSTRKDLISSKNNICNSSYLIIAKR